MICTKSASTAKISRVAMYFFGICLLLASCTKPPTPGKPIEKDNGQPTETADVELARGADSKPFAEMHHALPALPAPILFDLNSSTLTLSQADALNGLVVYLKRTGASVTLEGYTCPIGEEGYNLNLGQRRAEAVRGFLLAVGILGSRIETVSYGEDRPVSLDPDRFDLNRRVVARLD